ncbi:MFS transporter [Fibrella forsythiae]|uniref:MFS transporter n=1 Tax=Fibrella forsythiae TaxID=2817061 RepID=A0ABS3JR95_9BACT|nr:MFS transporter [Fibrella forsythiae]MBO0952536.1 MFS transporter [Fibrella forsythiae]
MTSYTRLPALANSTFWRYFAFTALYFAEGLQMGLLFVGIPAWMAQNAKTPTEIGQFATACALPWTFKFVVAPLMDRYTYLPMGRKRPWVLFGQFGLVASLIVMAYVPDPLGNLQLFAGAAFLVSTFGALQDAAVDGMAVDVIPGDQQARANGFMGGARMIGSSLALAGGSWLLNQYSFTVAALAVAFTVGLLTVVPILLREAESEKFFPWTDGIASPESRNLQVSNWRTIVRSLFSLFRLKNSLLVSLLMFITMGSYNYFETLLPIFAVNVSGWTNVSYSQAFASADLIGGISGILLGGVLIERFGKKRMIGLYFLGIMGIATAFALLTDYWTDRVFVHGFIIVYRWLNAFAKIGVYAIAMECCSRKVSASQFTFYMTIGAVGSMVGATLIGPVKEHVSWGIAFAAFVALIAVSWLILQSLNIRQQVEQITRLEKADNTEEKLLLN